MRLVKVDEAIATLESLGWPQGRIRRVDSETDCNPYGSVMYFLFDDTDELIYVGYTSDIVNRLRNHRRGKGASNHPHAYALVLDLVAVCLGKRATETEAELIYLLDPPENLRRRCTKR
jgi:predicted GIY-YIG superfamily endonuclease